MKVAAVRPLVWLKCGILFGSVLKHSNCIRRQIQTDFQFIKTGRKPLNEVSFKYKYTESNVGKTREMLNQTK